MDIGNIELTVSIAKTLIRAYLDLNFTQYSCNFILPSKCILRSDLATEEQKSTTVFVNGEKLITFTVVQIGVIKVLQWKNDDKPHEEINVTNAEFRNYLIDKLYEEKKPTFTSSSTITSNDDGGEM